MAQSAVALAGDDVVSHALAIHRCVGSTLAYAPGSTYIGVEIDQVLERRMGVCQDFAHLGVAMCRSVGLPARYVSGYLFTMDDATGSDTEEDEVKVQTHAWMEVAIPGYGWLGLDPTNQQQAGLRHVKIGHGRDYDDVLPLRGVYAGSAQPLVTVSVDIRRMSTASASPRRSPSSLPGVISSGSTSIDLGAQQQQQQQ